MITAESIVLRLTGQAPKATQQTWQCERDEGSDVGRKKVCVCEGGRQMRKVLPGDLCLFPGWDMNLG